MSEAKSLPAPKLRAVLNPSDIPWTTSSEVPQRTCQGSLEMSFQPRVSHSIDIAVQIKEPGYNIYLSGDNDLGRTSLLLSALAPLAHKMPPPPDIAYVFNFDKPDEPRACLLPAGQAGKLKRGLKEVLEKISQEGLKRAESSTHLNAKSDLLVNFQNTRMKLLRKMDALAARHGFNLELDENGAITLFPLAVARKTAQIGLAAEETPSGPDMEPAGKELSGSLGHCLHKLRKAELDLRDAEKKLGQQLLSKVLDDYFEPFARRMLKVCRLTDLSGFFMQIREDILKNTELFLQNTEPATGHGPDISPGEPMALPSVLFRYDINIIVDNSKNVGAPIIVEDNPNAINLLGCLERESEMGALVTDFTLIRAGSLLRANGGFLILHVEDLFQHPLAWEGLLRSLQAGKAVIEDATENIDAPLRAKTVMPESVDIDLKVILIGDDAAYESLLMNDYRFSRLFHIKAHMAATIERNKKNILRFARHMSEIIAELNLLPFDRSALAALADLSTELCEDQKSLSLKIPVLRECMIEASILGKKQRKTIIDSEIVRQAYENRRFRANLIENLFFEDYSRDLIKIKTTGQSIGQVNGLSVAVNGDYEFGLPHRISCAIGVGQEGIIDLEREADLGGPIHTKAMLIIKSFLTNLFAGKKPLVLTGSIYFEQNYAEIEGDSASGAELIALLSALAEVPVRMDMAFTGAVNHNGEIMAVGGVTKKIEAFFRLCVSRGLTGSQGVIIPQDNVGHLMLSEDVIAAVKKGLFTVYAVRRIEEAIKLLTGLDAGRKLKNGKYSAGSLYNLVDRRLENLGFDAHNAYQKKSRDIKRQ